MSEAEPESPGRKSGGIGRLLRYLFAAVLLWLVAHSVPWADRVEIGDPKAENLVTLVGTIDGHWNREAIDFVVEELPASVPDVEEHAELARAIADGRLALGTRLQVTESSLRPPTGDPVVAQVRWRPGMPSAFAELEARELLPALGFLILGSLFAVTRWWRLLALIGCPASLPETFRLTYVGLFFNLVVPGLNGGDVARGVLVVRRHPDRRADALMSVLVDRMLGLIAMIALAVVAVFGVGEDLTELRAATLATFVCVLCGLAAFLNPTIRRWTHFDSIVGRLPQSERLRKLDSALIEYARHPGSVALALLLSVGNHASVTAAILSLGHAFGADLEPLAYLAIVTVTNTITSLPIAPAGWGVGEAAFRAFFVALGSVATLGVAVSVTYRLLNAALSLAGGLFLLLPSGRDARAQLAEESPGGGTLSADVD